MGGINIKSERANRARLSTLLLVLVLVLLLLLLLLSLVWGSFHVDVSGA